MKLAAFLAQHECYQQMLSVAKAKSLRMACPQDPATACLYVDHRRA